VQLNSEVRGDLGVIRVTGDVDTLTAPDLNDLAERMLGGRTRNLVIDVRDVEFVDSTGLHALADAHRLADSRSGTVTVRGPGPFLHRLLQITGLDQVLVVDGLLDAEDGAGGSASAPRCSGDGVEVGDQGRVVGGSFQATFDVVDPRGVEL
jgi:anti-sigma B factor antagonist